MSTSSIAALHRVVTWIVLALGALAAVAEEPRVAYKDIDGRWHVIDPGEWPQVPPSRAGTVRILSRNVTYNVTYLDVVNNTNVGFDDPVFGATRQATLEAVLDSIDSVLGETGTVGIEFSESQTDGSGNLASAGAFYSPLDGFVPGFAFRHITTGVDPSGLVPDINATVDFGWPWNSDTGPPAPGENDLFSALLHEITHGLGVASLTGSDGLGELMNESMDFPNTLSTFDDLLYTGNGKKLWTAGGVFNGVASDLTGGDGGVEFRGPRATAAFGAAPAVFAPNPFQGGSIGHWDDGIGSGAAVMQPVMITGVQRREYTGWELAALRDLGYSVQPIFSDDFESGNTTVWSSTVP